MPTVTEGSRTAAGGQGNICCVDGVVNNKPLNSTSASSSSMADTSTVTKALQLAGCTKNNEAALPVQHRHIPSKPILKKTVGATRTRRRLATDLSFHSRATRCDNTKQAGRIHRQYGCARARPQGGAHSHGALQGLSLLGQKTPPENTAHGAVTNIRDVLTGMKAGSISRVFAVNFTA
jgi:hypothetical protein